MLLRIMQKYTNNYKGKSKKRAVAIVTKGKGQQKKSSVNKYLISYY